MNKSELFRLLMDRDPLENMLPLTDVHTQEDIKKFAEEGYSPLNMTAEDWKTRYPSIPLDKIYCVKSNILPSALAYYDKEKYIYIEFMHGGLVLNPATFESDVSHAIQRATDAYEQKRYMELLMPNISENSGNTTLRLAKNMLRNEVPSAQLYDAVITAYMMVDNAGRGFEVDDIQRLKACKSEEQWEKTEELLAYMPNEITVYRGMGGASLPSDKALSWTTDPSIAYFFAARRDDKSAYIVKGTVSKEAVIEYIDSTESEIIVDPKDVKDVKIVSACVPMEDFLEEISRIPYSVIQKGITKVAMTAVRDKIVEVYANGENSLHDKEHTIRVSCMAGYLFQKEYLPFAEKNRFDEWHVAKMFKRLMASVIYHDRGRIDDEDDLDHGIRGYAIYVKSHPKNPLVEFMIKGHVEDDRNMERLFRRCKVKEVPYEEGRLLLSIMKDADALDRWRFGLCRDFVNVEMLRLPTSSSLMAVAASMQNMDLE